MNKKIYCPYTNTEIYTNSSSIEHIIPLSLGGSNGFTIPVSKEYNCKAGSEIDGDMANDFLILLRRSDFDARGHSNKKPKVIAKKSIMGKDNRPVQLEFSDNKELIVYDPIKKRILSKQETSGERFNSQFTISRFTRIKFAAKVALSGGYLTFGEWFRKNVSHNELRELMKINSKSQENDFSEFGIQVYDEFTQPNKIDSEQYELDKILCTTVRGSCIYFIPGPKNLGVIVGVLGQHVATLNIPANTDEFPFTKLNDLGHAILIESNQTKRISYRQFAEIAYGRLKNSNYHKLTLTSDSPPITSKLKF